MKEASSSIPKVANPTAVAAPEQKSVSGFVSNVASSAGNFVKGIGQMVAHPIETGKNLFNVGLGTAEKAIPGRQGAEDQADQVGQFLKERYGSWDKVKDTAYRDPVGFLSDASTIVGGAGGALRAAGNATKLSRVSTAGTALSKVSKLTDPLTAPTEALRSVIPSRMAGKAAANTYAKALQPSRSFSPEERASMIDTGLKEGIPVSQKGLDQTYDLIEKTNDSIDELIKSTASTSGSKAYIKTQDILKRIAPVYKEFAGADTPSVFVRQIDDYLKQVADEHGEFMTITEAQAVKRSIYKQLKNDYGEFTTAVKESKKGVARGAKEEMNARFPELATLNAKDSGLIQLEEALKAAVSRGNNKATFGLKEIAALINPKVLAAVILDNPEVRSKLGIALQKVADKKPSNPGKVRRSTTPLVRINQSQQKEKKPR